MCPASPMPQDDGLDAVTERVREYLISRAQAADPARPFAAVVTYGDLVDEADPEHAYFAWPRFRGIGEVLRRISTYEHQHGRPMLSALVVRKQTRQAGDGFAVLGRELGEHIQEGEERSFWRSQVEAVVRQWSGQDGAQETPDVRELLAQAIATIEEARRLLSRA
jgi:hypothetical protein